MVQSAIQEIVYPDSRQCFLMAEDDPADAELFSGMLSQAFDNRYSVMCVDRFEKIADALDRGSFQALILDMNLPDRSGIENVHTIGQQYPHLPIVVLTGDDESYSAIDSLQSGAQDYLSKNTVTPETLARSVEFAKERKLVEKRLKQALEDAAFRNVQLEAQANHDPLTGLANRAYFQDAAERVLLRAKRKDLRVALLYFDLNGFKKINDSYGHAVGDDLLQQFAERLKSAVRDADFIARIGGDEFVIITDTMQDKEEVYPFIRRLQRQFETGFQLGAHRLRIHPSIGVAFYPDAEDLDLLVKQADCAMYQAKTSSDTTACFYSEHVELQYTRLQKVEQNLRDAIRNHELSAAFQPIVSVTSSKEVQLEALARWHSDLLDEVSPSEFIPIVENSSLLNDIAHSVVKNVAEMYRTARDRGLSVDRVAVNVSAQQLSSANFCQSILEAIHDSDMSPENLTLELTERQSIDNIRTCQSQMEFMRMRGVHIALDDFGSGFSSIGHLLELPLDLLKLDRTLIHKVEDNVRNQALVAGITEMAHRLGIKVVAEGIETEAEMRQSIDLGCDYMQGFLFSKPVPVNEAALYYEMRRH
ncbi:MAG: EAL domain-containing protein [Pseudomonadota bacterium]